LAQIAEAKVKTDKVDARILAQLLAADLLPGTWVADDRTRMLRRLVLRRTHLVKQGTRVKNQVHSILARNPVPTCPPTCSPVSVSARRPDAAGGDPRGADRGLDAARRPEAARNCRLRCVRAERAGARDRQRGDRGDA
jgi:hypothetical protein